MFVLSRDDYGKVKRLFEVINYKTGIRSVLEGIIRGEVYVDDLEKPKNAFMAAHNEHYLVGDGRNEEFYRELSEVIPVKYELAYGKNLEEKIPRILEGKLAVKQQRRFYTLRNLKHLDYRSHLGKYCLLRVDGESIRNEQYTQLKNFAKMVDSYFCFNEWIDPEHILKIGAGYCIIDTENNTVASWCFCGCAAGDRADVGIFTEYNYRRRGLGAIVAAATIENLLNHGYRSIGWDCLNNNIGSYSFAEKIGFELQTVYDFYSARFPAENASDLSSEEWKIWAERYENACDLSPRFNYEYAYSTLLSGNIDKASSIIKKMVDHGWRMNEELLEEFKIDWNLNELNNSKEWQHILRSLECEVII